MALFLHYRAGSSVLQQEYSQAAITAVCRWGFPVGIASGHAFPADPIIRGILPRIDVETSKEIIQPRRFRCKQSAMCFQIDNDNGSLLRIDQDPFDGGVIDLVKRQGIFSRKLIIPKNA